VNKIYSKSPEIIKNSMPESIRKNSVLLHLIDPIGPGKKRMSKSSKSSSEGRKRLGSTRVSIRFTAKKRSSFFT
jgi:hypothetical protein